MTLKIAIQVVIGFVAAAVLALGTDAKNVGALLFFGSVAVFLLLLIIGPSILLRQGVRWWVFAVAGAVAGLVGAAVFASAATPGLCFFGGCPPPPPFPFGIFFTILLGLLAIGEAIGLKAAISRRALWAVAGILAGAAFGFTIQGLDAALHLDAENVNLIPGIVAGALWGLIVGIGLLLQGAAPAQQGSPG